MVRVLKVSLLAIVVLMSACHKPTPVAKDGPPKHYADISKIGNAVPKHESHSRYGNPKKYTVLGKSYRVMSHSKNYKERGLASWYGSKFHNRRTSSGEPYNVYAMTAAHKTLPLPTYAQVTNLENGRQVILKINDRGPFHPNRIIDLSYVAAKKLGISGTARVEVTALDTKPKHAQWNAVNQPNIETPTTRIRQPQLYLQVGSFTERNNAQQLAARIQKLTNEKVRLDTGNQKDHPIYRVQVGPLAGAELTGVHRAIKTAGIGNPLTVVR